MLAALAIIAMPAGKAIAYTVDGPRRPKPWEITAVYELEDYLKKLSSGASIRVGGAEACFHVGDTEFTRKQGLASASFEDEQWTVKCFGSDVVLVGGGTRGTLYAVYHFLEDVCGVRWWSDDEEDVPQAGTLELKPFDMKGRPALRCRQIFRKGRTSWRTAARCRLNSNGDYVIPVEWGAEWRSAAGSKQADAGPASTASIDVIKSAGFPIPSEYTIVEKIRACAERGKKGITIEQDDPDRSDMYELKFFIARKALEDPSLKTEDLLHEFYLRYYGPVAGKIRRAREHLRQIFDERGISVSGASPGKFGWLTPEDLSLAARFFDEAEEAAKGNPKLERRVKRARISLDLVQTAAARPVQSS